MQTVDAGKLCLLVDYREHLLIDAFKCIDTAKYNYPVFSVNLSVADIIICRSISNCSEQEEKSSKMLDKHATLDGSGICDKLHCSLVPLFAIERKTPQDLTSSLAQKSDTPGFNRLKDQKMRLTTFCDETNCRPGILIENYIVEIIADLHSLSNTLQQIDKRQIVEMYTTSIVAELHKLSERLSVTDDTNDVQQYITSTIGAVQKLGQQKFSSTSSTDHRLLPENAFHTIITKACTRDGFFCLLTTGIHDTARTASKLTQLCETENITIDGWLRFGSGGNTSGLQVRKRENWNPANWYRAALMSVPGVNTGQFDAICLRYSSMPMLIKAYEKRTDSQCKRLLQDFPIVGSKKTKNGNDRKLGKALSERIYNIIICPQEPEPVESISDSDDSFDLHIPKRKKK